MTNENVRPSASVTRRERNVNAFRALAKLVPVVGEGIDQLAFGPLDDLRAKRVEETLTEIAAGVERMGTRSTDAEEYANLLESAIPKIARSTSEQMRRRFRDLLINAASVPADDPRWAQAELAQQLLCELAPPALSLLACLTRRGVEATSQIVSRPEPQVVAEGFDWDRPTLTGERIGYSWPTINEWAYRLREKRLLAFNSGDARGGFGGVTLTELGIMLVQWVIADSGSH